MAEAAAIPALRDAPARGLVPALRFVWRNRMFTPRYWAFGLRYLWRFKVLSRHIRTAGMVFLGRGAEVFCRRGLGHMEIGRWVWIGKGNAIRCHEGFLRIGDKVVFGTNDTVTAYLDVEIGAGTLVADSVFVTDFDHRFADPAIPIRKQGIVTARVRIEDDCWIGEKASILRGSTVGRGSVIGVAVGGEGAPPAVLGGRGRSRPRREAPRLRRPGVILGRGWVGVGAPGPVAGGAGPPEGPTGKAGGGRASWDQALQEWEGPGARTAPGPQPPAEAIHGPESHPGMNRRWRWFVLMPTGLPRRVIRVREGQRRDERRNARISGDPGPRPPQGEPDLPRGSGLRAAGVRDQAVEVQPVTAVLAARARQAVLRARQEA